MEAPHPSKLRLWEGPTTAVMHHPSAPTARSGAGPHHPADFADHLYAAESLKGSTAGPKSEGAEPYTLQWFLDIETQRHARQGRWIPKLLEFRRHAGDTLLGLGNGLGTDWLQYARHGANVVACSPSADQLALIRRNFELRGLAGRFVHAAPALLPLEPASIDVACVSGLLHEVADAEAVVEEVYRVLKPGGKVLAVTAARFDSRYWFHREFFWPRPFRPKHYRGRPEDATFTARALRRLFGRFIEHRVYKRQLRRSEVPHVWRWLPVSVLERMWGHVLVLKAFKPLSAAITVPAAA